MRKRIINASIVLSFLSALSISSAWMGKCIPKDLKAENGANMAVTDTYVKPIKTINDVEIVENEVETVGNANDDEIFCDSLETLAICVEAEAGNQDLYGKRLVVDVILNRVDSERFPDNIEDVISQKYQFTTYWDGSMGRVDEPSPETYEAVRLELESRTDDSILFFTYNSIILHFLKCPFSFNHIQIISIHHKCECSNISINNTFIYHYFLL